MKLKRTTKETLKKVLVAVLVVGAVAGAAVGIKELNEYRDEDTKVIHPRFEIGGLDTNGKYVEQETTLYTKEAFECLGLTITPDFDSDITYQIFFYEEDGDFISSSEVLEETYNETLPAGATHARVMITPKWTNVEDEDDQELTWYNKSSFVNQLTIEVDKEQEVEKDSGSSTSSEATA